MKCKSAEQLRALADNLEKVCSASPVMSVACIIVSVCADNLRAIARIHELQEQEHARQNLA